jgi:hypothetical protein
MLILAKSCGSAIPSYERDSDRFYGFAMLAADWLCYNRLSCAVTARSP